MNIIKAAKVIGRRIVEVRRLEQDELDALMWTGNQRGIAVVLDDGSELIASSDQERNGPGELLLVDEVECSLLDV